MNGRHPLGFTKINLLTIHGRRIRLHLWHGPTSEAPHNHRWPFIGISLWGNFTETRWTTTPGATHQAVTTTPPEHGQARSYRPTTAHTRLIPDRVRTRRPLIPYRCPAGVIHSYTPSGDGPHISLVLLGLRRSTTSTVWQPRGDA